MNGSVLHFISPPIPYFVDCGRAYYVPGECHIRRNCIGVFDLIVVTKGALFMGEGSAQWEVGQGEALILRPDSNHYGAAPCRRETEIMWIHFQTFGAWNEYDGMNSCLENQSALIDSHKKNAYLHHSEVCSIFIPKHTKLSAKALDDLEQFYQLGNEPKSLRNWKRQTVFQLLLQHLDRDLASLIDTAAVQLAEKVEIFIRQNYRKKITNAVLQKELSYHPNYLAKCMLKVYGMTPMEFLTKYRIEQAKKLLIQREWSITRIAEEAGFAHGSYFSYIFSKQEGISPLTFRKKFIGHR
ncbi:AraC family transcriptional regulator [Paenibacillus hamazuiensis]|uniref:AraC family transcriptional regulator n=1 Tax=Paenibacillus hamazuiensis TaxID=2936508 RepID=UPI00200E2F73|nr:helix-turn-helix domain-containing protein [Paenibacillus hamazuiensis]